MTVKTIRHKKSPFYENMLIPIGSKNVQISQMGKESNILVNQHSGEVVGTHVIARKRVDAEKFIKTFADYMAFTFELTKAGNKALRVVMWAMKEQSINKDEVILDRHTHEGFLSVHSNSKKSLTLSYPTFARGLAELEKSKIIAKTMRVGHYFINPSCMFNGNRIAFTTAIELKEGNEH
jgi:hypothetical protein